ncbi:unnamed protein product, partial [marine sediment metagenome]
TAFSKGEPRWYVYSVHGFRNAAIPVMIIIISSIIRLVGGVIFIENIFSWPGMGVLLVAAVNNRDYPVILGILLVLSFFALTLSILIDVVTALLDPRVRYK